MDILFSVRLDYEESSVRVPRLRHHRLWLDVGQIQFFEALLDRLRHIFGRLKNLSRTLALSHFRINVLLQFLLFLLRKLSVDFERWKLVFEHRIRV